MMNDLPNKKRHSLEDDLHNRALLGSLLHLGEDELSHQRILVEALAFGEESGFVKHFNPKNHLTQIHADNK
jgi:hypothetical protein